MHQTTKGSFLVKCLLTSIVLAVARPVFAQPTLSLTSNYGLDRVWNGLSGGKNFVKNGSFEYTNNATLTKADVTKDYHFIPNGTSPNPSYAVPDTVAAIPDWVGGGGGANTYAIWHSDKQTGGTNTPAKSLVNWNEGDRGVYFGNWRFKTSVAPTFANDNSGIVTFSSTPTFTHITGDGGASSDTVLTGYGITGTPTTTGVGVTLSQTVTGLQVGVNTVVGFWVTGELTGGTAAQEYDRDGVFRFGLTDSSGSSSMYLAVPNGDATTTKMLASGGVALKSKYYQVKFTPTTSSVTLTFENYGHIMWGQGSNINVTNNDATAFALRGTELVLDDVIINQSPVVIPEPSPIVLAALGLCALIGVQKRHRS